jgi:hypothetical protein
LNKPELVELLAQVREATRVQVLHLKDYYGVSEFDQRIWDKVELIGNVKALELEVTQNGTLEFDRQTKYSAITLLAHTKARKALDSAQISALSQWSTGKATGPATPENLEKRAAKAESMGKWLKDQGKHEQAEKQFLKARALFEEAARLRKGEANGSVQ